MKHHSFFLQKEMSVGYTAGVFDFFHRGHAEILQKAASLCDKLIVGVTTDESCKYKNVVPTFNQRDRKRVVESVKGVSCVIYQDTTNKYEMWKKLKFDILIVGDDWFETASWKEYEELLREEHVKIVYLPRTPDICSTQIRGFKKPMFVIDLDFTFWNFDSGKVNVDNIQYLSPFPQALNVVKTLVDSDFIVCVASRSMNPSVADKILNQQNIKFGEKCISPSINGKKMHLAYIHQQTKIPYNQTILFDDDIRNFKDLEQLGIICHQVDRNIGLTWEDVSKALLKFHKNT